MYVTGVCPCDCHLWVHSSAAFSCYVYYFGHVGLELQSFAQIVEIHSLTSSWQLPNFLFQIISLFTPFQQNLLSVLLYLLNYLSQIQSLMLWACDHVRNFAPKLLANILVTMLFVKIHIVINRLMAILTIVKLVLILGLFISLVKPLFEQFQIGFEFCWVVVLLTE